MSAEVVDATLKGFLIGIQFIILLIVVIITIIDMKNTKKQLNQTDNWIKSIDNQMKFEQCMLDNIDSLAKKVLIIENQLGIKEEEEEEEPKDE